MMSQNVLTKKGTIFPIQAFRRLNQAELDNPNELRVRKAFDERIESLYGTCTAPPPNWNAMRRKKDDDQLEEDLLWEELDENNKNDEVFPYVDNSGNQEYQMPDIDEVPDLDRLIGTKVVLPQDGIRMQMGQVVGRVTDGGGRPVGNYHKDPLLDTRVYDVIFPDGSSQQYSANLIAESIYMECDDNGSLRKPKLQRDGKY